MGEKDLEVIQKFVKVVAQRSDVVSHLAGVGGMEVAGHLISYLAEHPDKLVPWLRDGFFAFNIDWMDYGALTYVANNGEIVSPSDARQVRETKL